MNNYNYQKFPQGKSILKRYYQINNILNDNLTRNKLITNVNNNIYNNNLARRHMSTSNLAVITKL